MIEFKDISLTFGNKIILDKFNYKVDYGEKIWLNGKSGSGKSSFAKLLLGFLKPDSGEILLEKTMLDSLSVSKFRNRISYVSQDVDLFEGLVKEVITTIFKYPINKNNLLSKEKLRELLSTFYLEENILNKKISELSGGERQKIGFIINVLLDRDIWILDEVTSGLDEISKKSIIDYFIKNNKTIFIISHDNIFYEYENLKVLRWNNGNS